VVEVWRVRRRRPQRLRRPAPRPQLAHSRWPAASPILRRWPAHPIAGKLATGYLRSYLDDRIEPGSLGDTWELFGLWNHQ